MQRSAIAAGAGLGALMLGLVGLAQPAAAQDLAAAAALVHEHESLPEFVPPGPPFDARKAMAGKKILSIPVSSANPFTKNIDLAMIALAKQVGFELTEWENQARPTQWVQGMEYAINNKFNAIDMLGGTDPAVLRPQVLEAKRAGVKIFVSHLYDTNLAPDPSVDLSLPIPYHEVGRILAAWVTTRTQGKANVLVIGSDEIVPTKSYVKGFTDGLAKMCGSGCKYGYVNAPVPEWSTKIQPSVQSALLADPTINYVVPIYDSMSQFVIPAIRITGRRETVKIATFNGTPFVIDALRNGDVEMDIGESIGWIARSILDGYMRYFAGMPSDKELYVPLYIFDKSNVASAGVPAGYDKGYGNQYVAGYEKLWELK
jgi:ribose transport system substrate-binding protein